MIELIPAVPADASAPSDSEFRANLARALSLPGPGSLRIVERRQNPRQSTHGSELVRIEAADGRRLSLFVKIERPERRSTDGHWSGVAKEVQVYGRILSRIGVSAPVCHGAVQDRHGAWYLLLGEFGPFVRLSEASHPEGIVAAAAWLGRFQAAVSRHPTVMTDVPLLRYDGAHYAGIVTRAREQLESERLEAGWLASLDPACFLDTFGGRPETLIHGELYPHNVVIVDGTACAIDWESAALGPPEIDFAALLEGWDEASLSLALDAHRIAAGSDLPAIPRGRRLTAASLYLHLRWLAWPPRDRRPGRRAWRLQKAERAALELGLA